ncbi:SulP family inorganic anion transporter [Streptomyces sp. NPDC002588]|uniref:SulP family inorganic anion transporter n=1 Tax=Streptomyces sp. NPDC002588 TaxID=3154419 RepID=UPI0033249F5A
MCRGVRGVRKADLFASLAVFLVALPLYVGVALASGVPAESGLVTGIVGGLVVGLLPGSRPRISGPAAGLTVLGALGLGRWFRAVPVAVVQGMVAGIGLVLVAGQLYALGDTAAPAGGLAKLAGLVSLPGKADPVALSVGGATLVVLVLWGRWRRGSRLVPAPLPAVALAAGVTWLFDLDVQRIQVRWLWDAVRVPQAADLGRLTEVGAIGTVVAFALIASAESLSGAAAADRPHGGRRTDYDRELMAQGAGNAVCGVLGALPMTAVIVRSAAGGASEGVRAGARTKASMVLHGVWLLLFTAIVPGVLEVVPAAALAGLLVYAGCRLVPVRELRRLWRAHRAESLVLGVTSVAILVANLFQGVLIGLALAVAKTAWEISHVHVETEDRGDAGVVVRVAGHATFLRLPKLLDALDGLPADREVRLELGGLRHVDHACAAALEGWAAARERRAQRERERAGGLQGEVATSSSTS